VTRERIVIVGGGIAGLATAWWLGQAGDRDVVLLEREDALGLHSSGRNAAILRTAIPAPVNRALAAETREFLARPPAGFAPGPLLDACGLVIVTGEDGAGAAGEPCRELSAAAGLAPHFVPGPGRALHLPREGRIDIALLMDSLARGASARGVELRTGAAVDELLAAGGRVRGVRLADGTRLEAEWTVIAAGGWAARLGRRAGSRVELRATRRHIGVTRADGQVDPRWPIVWSDVDGFYARPEGGGMLVCACDQTDVDPDACREDPGVRATLLRAAARHLPSLAPVALDRFWAGVRTLTADGSAVVGADDEVPGLFWVAGLGGHGMTTSIATGRIAAEALRGGGAGDPGRALDPARQAASGRT